MLPDKDPNRVYSWLVSLDNDVDATVEALLQTAEEEESKEPHVILDDDFLSLDDPPPAGTYDQMLAELLQAQEWHSAQNEQQEPPQPEKTTAPRKPPFKARFKEKLRNLFKKKKKVQLAEVQHAEELDRDVEVIRFGEPLPYTH